jgi:hypothetical protein
VHDDDDARDSTQATAPSSTRACARIQHSSTATRQGKRERERGEAHRGTEGPSSLRERTCDQLPGAAHRSTARTTSVCGGRGTSRHTVSACKEISTVWVGWGTFEDVEVLVDLKQLEGRTRPPALLLCFPVVDVLSYIFLLIYIIFCFYNLYH